MWLPVGAVVTFRPCNDLKTMLLHTCLTYVFRSFTKLPYNAKNCNNAQ